MSSHYSNRSTWHQIGIPRSELLSRFNLFNFCVNLCVKNWRYDLHQTHSANATHTKMHRKQKTSLGNEPANLRFRVYLSHWNATHISSVECFYAERVFILYSYLHARIKYNLCVTCPLCTYGIIILEQIVWMKHSSCSKICLWCLLIDIFFLMYVILGVRLTIHFGKSSLTSDNAVMTF